MHESARGSHTSFDVEHRHVGHMRHGRHLSLLKGLSDPIETGTKWTSWGSHAPEHGLLRQLRRGPFSSVARPDTVRHVRRL